MDGLLNRINDGLMAEARRTTVPAEENTEQSGLFCPLGMYVFSGFHGGSRSKSCHDNRRAATSRNGEEAPRHNNAFRPSTTYGSSSGSLPMEDIETASTSSSERKTWTPSSPQQTR